MDEDLRLAAADLAKSAANLAAYMTGVLKQGSGTKAAARNMLVDVEKKVAAVEAILGKHEQSHRRSSLS